MSFQSFIKSEPVDDTDVTNNMDEDEAENVQMEIDPSQFLARSEDEIDDDESNADDDEDDEDPNGHNDNNGPPILTSLGLTHINSVNPFSYMVMILKFTINNVNSVVIIVMIISVFLEQ